jgi:hypothetical protein
MADGHNPPGLQMAPKTHIAIHYAKHGKPYVFHRFCQNGGIDLARGRNNTEGKGMG